MEGHTELEHKYDVEADFVPPDMVDVPGCAGVAEPRVSTLDAWYYDTDDLRLAASGITLRRRTGGDDAGWHLKLPVAEHVRREIRLPLDAGERTVPSRLADLVAAYIRGRPLEPAVRLETRRVERAISGQDGRVLAVLADDTVRAQRLSHDGDALRLTSWREMEVEAVHGRPELVTAVGERLRERGARPAAIGSKMARVLADDLPAAGPASSGSPAPPRTAGDLLLAAVRAQVGELLARDPLVRLADHDDDSVHKMRVAVRRLRSLLRTHRRLVDHARGTALDWELHWLADALGRVRDLEMLAARLDRHLAELSGAHRPALLGELAEEELAARDELRRALLSRRYFDLLDALDAFLVAPPFTERAGRPAEEETPAIAARAWRKMVRRHSEADLLPDGRARDTALHSVRKAAKRARYTADAAAPFIGGATKLARRAKRLQKTLGAHHDAAVTAERLAETARRPGVSAEDAFVLGRLAELEERAKRDALRALPAVARKVRKRKARKDLRPC